MALPVLLYVPNVIGYVRLVLLVVSWLMFYDRPVMSFFWYSLSLSLDCVDGWSARKLKQVSAFGAWFDVFIDIVGRGMLWSRLYNFGYLVACLEWVCFVCTHQLGSSWKYPSSNEPWFVKAVMANNFCTPLGTLAIGGLHVLPLWLYGHYHGVLTYFYLPYLVQYSVIAVLAAGRAVCAAVELVIGSELNQDIVAHSVALPLARRGGDFFLSLPFQESLGMVYMVTYRVLNQ